MFSPFGIGYPVTMTLGDVFVSEDNLQTLEQRLSHYTQRHLEGGYYVSPAMREAITEALGDLDALLDLAGFAARYERGDLVSLRLLASRATNLTEAVVDYLAEVARTGSAIVWVFGGTGRTVRWTYLGDGDCDETVTN